MKDLEQHSKLISEFEKLEGTTSNMFDEKDWLRFDRFVKNRQKEMLKDDEELIKKFEDFIGYERTLFNNEEWRECNSFIKGFNLAQKESEAIFKTERQYWLDKEATDLRTNTEIINSKYSAEEVLELLLKANDKAPDFGWGREDLEDWFNTIKK